ncbi:MAG: hypothetical protein RJA99_3192 [Pseudomonadota bacterium]|jgi:hypothetical protein
MKSLMKAKKVGRFADGGEVTTMTDGTEVVNDMSPKTSGESPAAPTSSPEPSSFKEAFASARKGGAKTFEWKGKKYTTEMASSKPAAPKPSRSLSQGLGEKYAAVDRAYRNMPAETSPSAREALTKMRDSSRAAYEKAAESERTGKSVVKLASGGLVRLGKLKSHGKAC